MNLRSSALVLATLMTVGLAACKNNGSDSAGDLCGTCSDVFVNGGVVCGGTSGSDAWDALSLCACGDGPCASACGGSLCNNESSDLMCGTCLVDSCSKQEKACADN